MSESRMQDEFNAAAQCVVFDLDDDMLQARHEPGLIGN